MTEWKVVDGYPNFKISNEGKLIYKASDDSSEIEWPVWTAGRVSLRDENGKSSKPLHIHRLVAEHFVECQLSDNPNRDCYYVKHIDGDLQNNRADNLYWSISVQGPYTMRRRPRQLKTSVSIRETDSRHSITVYISHNGNKHEKEFRYKRIGKEKAMEKANEYVKKFKEEHDIKC